MLKTSPHELKIEKVNKKKIVRAMTIIGLHINFDERAILSSLRDLLDIMSMGNLFPLILLYEEKGCHKSCCKAGFDLSDIRIL